MGEIFKNPAVHVILLGLIVAAADLCRDHAAQIRGEQRRIRINLVRRV